MKKITVAVTLDDKEGMLLFGKRQSRDRVLIAELVNSVGEEKICIAPFSRLLFEPYKQVKILDDPILECEDGSLCFVENIHIAPYLDYVETLIIYRWNRLYPSDFRFDVDPASEGFELVSTADFVGSSHEKITKEVYRK